MEPVPHFRAFLEYSIHLNNLQHLVEVKPNVVGGSKARSACNEPSNLQPPISNLQPPAFYLKPKITLPDDFRLKLLSGSSDEDSLLEDAFAVVREASKRVLGMRHFYCQMVGEALF